MSETETETTPDATQGADNGQPATVTLADATPAENGVYGATMRAEYGGYPTLKEYRDAQANLDDVMRRCGQADESAPATGIEAAVCADIARRQRRGIAKYGTTVIGNLLSFHQWLTHFYEELLDAAVYAKRIIHEHENQKQNQDDAGASGVLHRNPALHPSVPDAVPLRDPNGAGNDSAVCPGPAARPRKPGGGRKPLVCPSCGGIKTIGSSMKDGVPIKRCKVCGHVHKRYPNLANAAKAAP